MIQLYLGYGKGKTCAAVGSVIRMAGYNKKIIFAQFLKGRDSGEVKILRQIDGVMVIRNERDYGFYKTLGQDERERISREHNSNLNKIVQLMSKDKYAMVVLEEIGDAMELGCADYNIVKQIADIAKEKGVELIMTGHKENEYLIGMADYYSNINKVKHPYDHGVISREGIEY